LNAWRPGALTCPWLNGAAAEQLKAAYAVNEPLRALLPDGTIAAPKGVYRFRTLAEANRQQDAWLAQAMAEARQSR